MGRVHSTYLTSRELMIGIHLHMVSRLCLILTRYRRILNTYDPKMFLDNCALTCKREY